MLKNIKLRKVLPLVILVGLAITAGGTNVFSEAVQTQVVQVAKDYLAAIKPLMGNIFVGLLFASIAYLAFDPIMLLLTKALNATKCDERGCRLISRTVNLFYWVLTIFISISFIAPGFLSQLLVGAGLFSAALALSFKGIAYDFICGVLLNFTPKCKVGDSIDIVGFKVEGKVSDIGYVMSKIETADGVVSVPNRELWDRPTNIRDPQKLAANAALAQSAAQAAAPPVGQTAPVTGPIVAQDGAPSTGAAQPPK